MSAPVVSSSTLLACKRASWDTSPVLVCNVEEAAMLVTAIAPSGTELKQIEPGDNAVLCLPVLVYQRAGEGLAPGEPRELAVPLELLGLSDPRPPAHA